MNEISLEDYTQDLAKSTDIYSRLSGPTRERLESRLNAKTKDLRSSLQEMEQRIRMVKSHPDGLGMGNLLAENFNKIEKAILGQRAHPIIFPSNTH